MAGDPARPRLNVVIFLEESLGSEFWGCLGRKDTLTPEMDKLAAEEGMLFTNLYATGNRTVRGIRGRAVFVPAAARGIHRQAGPLRQCRDHRPRVEAGRLRERVPIWRPRAV